MTGKGTAGTYYLDYVSLESGTPIVTPPTDYSNKLDSVYLRNDSLFQYVKGVETFKGKASVGGGTTTNSVTFNNSGTGDASGITFNGSVARTISSNTIGAVAKADSTTAYVTPTQLAAINNHINLYKPLYGVASDSSIHVYTETDTTLNDNSDTTLPTTKAVKAYVDNHAGGGGSGSVTSISQGYGIVNTPNPIVSTGTVTVDSSALSGYYVRRKDSTVSFVTPYQNSLKVSGGSIIWPGTLYSTPTTGSVSAGTLTFSPSLASQSAYTLFGRGSGSGTPSFLTSIDSNWIPSLHSENYFNTKYKSIGASGGLYAGSGSVFTTYAKGDLIYASGTDTLSRLSAGTNRYVLAMSNGLPAWTNLNVIDSSWVVTGGTHKNLDVYDLDGTTNLMHIGLSSTNGITSPSGALFGTVSIGGATPTVQSTGLTLLIGTGNGNQFNPFCMTYGGTGVTASHPNLNYHDFQGKIATFNSTTGDAAVFMRLEPTVSVTGTKLGGYVGLRINAIETAIPSGQNYLIQAGTGGATFTNKFGVTNTGQVLIGGATPTSSSLLNVASTTQAAHPYPNMTAAQKAAITSPNVGDHIYQTDGTEGVYVYKSTGWTFAY
jgi:hypothetical protein